MDLYHLLCAKQHPLVRTQVSGLWPNSGLLHQYLISTLVIRDTENTSGTFHFLLSFLHRYMLQRHYCTVKTYCRTCVQVFRQAAFE